MADLTELQAAQAVEITDTTGSNAAKINTSLPGSSDPALTVREAAQGQATMANSRPVVIASDQSAVPVSGTVTANAGTGTSTVAGGKTNNNAAPGATNVGVLPGLANAAAPSWSEGNQVALSTDLAGNLRTADKSVVAQGSTTSGQTGQLIQGAVTTAAPTYTTAQTNPLSLTTAGALRVDGSATTQPVSGTVTANAGTGTFATSNSETIADNAAFTDGTSRVFMGGHVFDETAGTALTENDAAASRIDSKRAQVFVIEDATTRGQRATVTASNAVKVDGSAVTQPVSGTVTANAGTGTFTVAGGKTNNNAAPGATNVGTLPALANAAAPSWTEGNQVSLSTDLAGSLRVQATGNVAHDAADSGNPVKVGGKARTANPTAVANGDRADLMTDDMGRLVVVNSHVRDLVATGNVALTSTTETTLLAAGGAGVFHDLTQLVMSNSSALPVDVIIRDATAGTIRATFTLASANNNNKTGCPTIVIPFSTPWPQTTANNNWTVQLSAALSTINIFAMAVKNV